MASTTLHESASHPHPTGLRPLFRPLARIGATLLLWLRRARMRRQLAQLDDRLLRDIGLDPLETRLAALCRYAWPGNVRELSNIIERCVILTHGSTLRVPADALQSRGAVVPDDTLEGVQRRHILHVLEECHGVIAGPTGAPARLGMKRTSLQYKLQKLGIVRRT